MPSLSDFADISKYEYIVGIDEVGWGALAGPISVGGVALPTDFLPNIKDSKKYSTHKARCKAWRLLTDSYSPDSLVRSAPVSLINVAGSGPSLAYITDQVMEYFLDKYPNALIVLDGDAHTKLPARVVSLPKADGFVHAVSAASVLAKISRDDYMASITGLDEWEFFKNKGYGTFHHLNMLKKHGPLEGLHREGAVKNICK